MVRHRIKKWLMEHPEALSALFLVATMASEELPGVTGKSAGSGTFGP